MKGLHDFFGLVKKTFRQTFLFWSARVFALDWWAPPVSWDRLVCFEIIDCFRCILALVKVSGFSWFFLCWKKNPISIFVSDFSSRKENLKNQSGETNLSRLRFLQEKWPTFTMSVVFFMSVDEELFELLSICEFQVKYSLTWSICLYRRISTKVSAVWENIFWEKT